MLDVSLNQSNNVLNTTKFCELTDNPTRNPIGANVNDKIDINSIVTYIIIGITNASNLWKYAPFIKNNNSNNNNNNNNS